MQHVQLLRIVVASPGDVQAERDVLPAIAEELNSGIAVSYGLRLEVGRWETDGYPGFHPEGPQGLIDPVLRIEDCDVLIGIFWKRFGTPTQDAQSGTEHEFRRAYEAWQQRGRPHIMMYFNERPYKPKTRAEIEQWGQVLDFQSAFPPEGLWWPYKNKTHFEKLERRHLTQWLRQQREDKLPHVNTPQTEHGGTAPMVAPSGPARAYLTWVMEQVRAMPLAGIDPRAFARTRGIWAGRVCTALATQRQATGARRCVGPGTQAALSAGGAQC
jgi:hypothetical protein